MEWLSQNWAWVLLIGGFVAIHLFGHGRHGGHGGHGGNVGCGGGHGDRKADGQDGEKRRPDEPTGHRH